MGHESRIEPWLPMTTVLLVSFRTDWLRREDTMKTAWKETGNRWAAVFSIRMDGAAGQNRTCSSTWGWKQEKFQRWGKCFLLTSPSIEHPPRRKRRGFLRPLGLFFPRWLRWVPPTTALLQRRTTKRLYFGLSAHRSFTREHFGVATFKKTRGPYIPGFKSRGFTALKGNAFPPYASKVVSDVPSLYAHNQARQTSEILAGRGVDHGAFAPGPQYPLGCSV